MKKTFLNLMVLAGLACMLTACNQDATDGFDNESRIDGTLSFIYDGKYYTSPYTEEGEKRIYADKETAALLEQLQANPELAMYVHPAGLLEFFDNQAKFENDFDVNRPGVSRLPFHNPWGYRITRGEANIYDGEKKKGSVFPLALTTPFTPIEFGDLRPFSMDKKVSSVTLYCTYVKITNPDYSTQPKSAVILTFYDQLNFQGQTVNFTVIPEYDWSEIHYFSSFGWNDRARSLKFYTHFGVKELND